MRLLSVILTCSIFLCVARAPALADKQYPTVVVGHAGSPVTITSCEAWARDLNVTALMIHKSVADFYFDLGVSLKNTSDKPVTAVRVAMTSYDSFNGVLGSTNADTASNQSANGMSIAPGAAIDLLGPRSWHGRNGHAERDHVSCEVTAVKFADGSTWSAQASTASQ